MLVYGMKLWQRMCVGNHQVLTSLLIISLGLMFCSPGLGEQTSTVDPNALKQSDWWQTVQQNISQMEYEVSWQEQCVIPGGKAGYHMTNRAQNLRAYFYPKGLKVVRRTEAEPSWVWDYQLSGFGRQGKLRSLAKPTLTVEKNRIEYHRGPLIERYENHKDGIEQIFVIAEPPSGSGPVVVQARLSGDLTTEVTADRSAIEFLHNGTAVLQYGGLQAMDANSRKLSAELFLVKDQLHIVLNDADAVYPLTIDPTIIGVSISLNWIGDSNQTNAQFATSVATAGDVNGDGYADIIVGAPFFDNGQSDEGRAFVFHGSATGLSTTASWTGESNEIDCEYGYSVGTAGDVNGDGYSDVIVGAPYSGVEDGKAYVYHGSAAGLSTTANWSDYRTGAYNNHFGISVGTAGDVNGDGYADVIVGEPGVYHHGCANVYHGSATGLSANPDWIGQDLQFDCFYGTSVATAGDVNGDGYSDIIVGAPRYMNGQYDEGAVFAYYGSSTGLSLGLYPDWSLEGDDEDARFGTSVCTAGDVNGDGYADVIIGAPFYYNSQIDEGRAFVFHGSSGGISTTANWTWESNKSAAEFGTSVATAGDVNGDGYADVIVGAPGFSDIYPSAGRAYAFFGSSAGLSTGINWMQDSNQTNAQFGTSVGTAGDVNGDGYADLIVGAPYYDGGQTDEGRAFVYHGSAMTLSTMANWTAESNQANAWFGWSLGTAGDVNGDGYADVIVGALIYDNGQTDEGRVFVFHGTATGLSSTANWRGESNQANATFGTSVGTAGDVNGDGYADVIIGADGYDNGLTDEGAAFVYHGSATGLGPDGTPANADWMWDGDEAGAYFGYSVGTAGDVNGDGYADVIVGAPFENNRALDDGAAYVYHGSATGLSTTTWNWAGIAYPIQAEAHYGWSVGTAGDTNRDGYSDIIVGAPWYDNGQTDEGRAFVYLGSPWGILGDEADWTAEGNQTEARFSWSVGTAGDVNGDGYADLIVGAPWYDNGQTDEGRAFVYHGSSMGPNTTANWSDESDQAPAHFGTSVGTAGDVNGDGYADVIVGSQLYSASEMGEGFAFVYHGSATGLSSTADWFAQSNQDSAWLGNCVGTAGDVNGDGYADVIVGAYGYDDGQANEGAAFVYYGNERRGLSLKPRQRRADNTAPIGRLCKSESSNSFRLALLGRTPFGRGKVKLQWEVKPLGTAFDGSGTQQSSSWHSTGTAGVELNELKSGLSANTVHHWRVRLRYHQATTPFQQFSRWLTMPWNGWQEADLRTAAAAPTPTPTPTGTPTATPTVTPTLTPTPSPTPSPTPTATVTPLPSPTPTPTATPSPTPTATLTPTPTPTATPVALIVEDSSGAPGATNVPVQISLENTMNVKSVQLTLCDVVDLQDLLTLGSQPPEPDPIRAPGFIVEANEAGGCVEVLMVSLTEDLIAPGTGPIFTLYYDVDAGATPGTEINMQLTADNVADENNDPLPVIPVDGIFTVGLKGDLDGDGDCNLFDVLRQIDIVLHKPPAPTPYELWAGDMDDDGDIDLFDVLSLIDYILG